MKSSEKQQKGKAAMKNNYVLTGILTISLGSTLAVGQALSGKQLGGEKKKDRGTEQDKQPDKEKSDTEKIREKLRGHGGKGSPEGKRPNQDRLGDGLQGEGKNLSDKLGLNEEQEKAWRELHREFAEKKKAIADRKAESPEEKRKKHEDLKALHEWLKKNLAEILTEDQLAKLEDLLEEAARSRRDDEGSQKPGGEGGGRDNQGRPERGDDDQEHGKHPINFKSILKELHEELNLTEEQKEAMEKNRQTWNIATRGIESNKELSIVEKKKRMHAAWLRFDKTRRSILSRDQYEVLKKIIAIHRQLDEKKDGQNAGKGGDREEGSSGHRRGGQSDRPGGQQQGGGNDREKGEGGREKGGNDREKGRPQGGNDREKGRPQGGKPEDPFGDLPNPNDGFDPGSGKGADGGSREKDGKNDRPDGFRRGSQPDRPGGQQRDR